MDQMFSYSSDSKELEVNLEAFDSYVNLQKAKSIEAARTIAIFTWLVLFPAVAVWVWAWAIGSL